jgi:hypothetical protein
MSNYSLPVRYGFIGALLMCIFGLFTYMFYRTLFSSFFVQMIFGLAYFASVIFIVVWGVVTYKREISEINFFKAFVAGMIIFSITMFASNFTSYIIPNYIDTDYPQQLYNLVKKSTAESMEKFGAPEEEIEKAMDRIEPDQFSPTLAKTAKAYGVSLGIGAILCLIVAAFVSRKNSSVSDIQPTHES